MRYYARACPLYGGATGAWTELFNWFVLARDRYYSQPRPIFEAITLGLAVLFGLLVMPALIYAAGRLTLREYANGGFFALYFDFFKGLFQLRPSCWIVVAGPFVFLTLYRVFRFILRKI
ncbi:MAG TPA: hypothetical protein VFV88_01830 [Steroidobacteraceae bacterium]|jgi:hypothetical protein|nr:hypothetical protein [Steroidobacteraceae bacterium]